MEKGTEDRTGFSLTDPETLTRGGLSSSRGFYLKLQFRVQLSVVSPE